MNLIDNYWKLIRYKLRYVGLRNTIRVAHLDMSDSLSYHISKHFPLVPFSPRSVQIECTTRCNLKCTFCELSYWTERPADLTLNNIQRMVAHLPNLKRIDLTGIGESLMNREFFKIVAFLKSSGMYISFNDNFTMMNDRAARRIVELEVDQIFLSLDGSTKQTYEQIRVGADFNKVISNARRLVQVKGEMRSWRPEIKINTVVCLSNYTELPSIVELAHEIGIGMVQFVNVITFDRTANLNTTAVQQELRAKFEEALDKARHLGILVKIELFEKLPVQQCDFPWKRNFVTYDGYVHPCCYTTQNGDRRAHNGRSFGNLLDHSFDELWNGDPYSAFRKKMERGILPYQCQHCPKYCGKPDREPAKLAS